MQILRHYIEFIRPTVRFWFCQLHEVETDEAIAF
jgi:hypothetical protein